MREGWAPFGGLQAPVDPEDPHLIQPVASRALDVERIIEDICVDEHPRRPAMARQRRSKTRKPARSEQPAAIVHPLATADRAASFDPRAAKSAQEAIRALDFASASTDEIQRLLNSLFTGLPLSRPRFEPGIALFSGRVGRKPMQLSELISQPPRKFRESRVVPYCNSREASVFALRPKVGDTISIIHWRTTAPLSLCCIGYSRRLFDVWGADRKVPAYAEIAEEHAKDVYDEALEFLADLFARGGENDGKDDHDRFVATIVEFLLTAPMFDGLMFPSAAIRGNADELMLKKSFTDKHVQFIKAEYFRITSVEDFSYRTQSLDSAPEVTQSGVIEWYAATPDAETGMPRRYGTIGWQEFLTQKRDLLKSLDSARERNANRPTRTEHGPIAEANLREWLEECLPRKYGVTSGFVIPDIRSMGYIIRHYDVIIYDAANAPVLWAERNPDKSEQGRTRAVPAEYVHAVFEVKTGLTEKSIEEALSKLSELGACRPHLPPHFVSAVIFFEVREKEQASCALVEQLFREGIPGYFGGLILRANGLDPNLTGYFTFSKDPKETVVEMPLVRDVSTVGRNEEGGISLPGAGDAVLAVAYDGVWNFDVGYAPMVKHVQLLWAYNSFPRFFFDLLARLSGKYDPTSASQRGGYGLSFVR